MGVLLVFLQACGSAEPERLSGQTMGTRYHVTWLSASGQPDREAVRAAVEGALESVNASMSTYRDDSEITAFNRAPAGQWVSVSEDFMAVFNMARRVSEASGGAYDVSVGPLVDLWGFGPDGKPGADRVPSVAAIAEARRGVGQGALRVDPKRGALLKEAPRELDFSSIAKGYGVDKVAGRLAELGIGNYLVEIGGEIRAAGVSHRGTPWRVAIERPGPFLSAATFGAASPAPLATLELSDRAVATSGDYRNFFEVDGHRYSHSIDPRTGWPVAHNLVSVTVLHESAALADAWATALTILGPTEAMRVAADNGLAVYLVSATGGDLQEGDLQVQKTPAIDPWLR